jgi:hypothetical protein
LHSSVSMAALILFFILGTAAVSHAAPITWQASSSLTVVHDPRNQWPGLEPGTDWSLTVTFDPLGPALNLAPGCNSYAAGPTTLVLGGFTYTQTAGAIYTNAILPEVGCASYAPGLIAFAWGPNWTQEPGAWNLNDPFSVLVAGYYDLNATDGSLPWTPVPNPAPGPYGGFDFNQFNQTLGFYSPFAPRALEQPAPVPEPATLGLMAAGLAALAARRRRSKSRVDPA